MEGMSFPVDNGLIEGQLTDLQSCFNLNSLYDKSLDKAQLKFRKDVFVRYLENLDITSDLSHDDLANNLYDWLDPDDYAVEAAGYDGDMYASLTFPYLSANSPLAHENELRVIFGFDVVVMAQIQKHFCVIPQSTSFEFNINTMDKAEPELLKAILDLDQAKVDAIIDARPEDGFTDIKDFWALPEMKNVKGVTAANNYFTVTSKFFKLITNAYYNDMKFALTSVIQLDDKYNSYVIGRRFGGNVERKANPEDEQPTN
jgi:general secretion pathway protein K